MIDVASVTGMVTPFVTQPAFNLAVKTPIILADLALGVVLFHFVRDVKDERWASRLFLLWFLNPLVIWVSSVSPQFDVFPVLLTLIAFICFYKKRFLMAGLALGIGILFKIYPVYLLLFYLALAIWIKGKGSDTSRLWERLKKSSYVLVGALVSLVVIVPFLFSSPGMVDIVLRRAGTTSFGGFNLWFLAPLISEDLQSVFLPLGIYLSAIILVATIGLILFLSRKYSIELSSESKFLYTFTLGNVAVLSLVLLSQPVTNPQHLLWILPFLLILAIWWEDRAERKVFLLSIAGFLYFIGLQSFHAFFYPTASYFDFVSIESLSSSVKTYFMADGIITRHFWTTMSALVGVLTLVTIWLPERFDIIERAVTYIGRWRG